MKILRLTSSCTHFRLSPNCSFIQGTEAPSLRVVMPKYPQFDTSLKRLSSFYNWPTDNGQTPEELAKAGFIYLGIFYKLKS